MRRKLTGLLAGLALSLAAGTSALAQELTIFWAEWDPANYLQELVNEYEAEDRREGHGRNDAVVRLPDQGLHRVQRQGRRLRHGRRRLAVAWCGLDGRSLCRPDRLLQQAQAERSHGAGHGEVLRRISRQLRQVLGDPAEGDAVGWSYRKDWFEDPKEMDAFKAKYGYDLAVPKNWKALRDIAEFFHRPDEKRYGIAIYTDNSYDALVMGVENAIFSYGGELGDYDDLQGRRHHQLRQGGRRARGLQGALQVHASGLGQDLLRGKQPGHHRKPGGNEHELLRLLPGAGERGDATRTPRTPASSPIRQARAANSSRRSAARASRSSPTRRTRKNR